MSMDKYGFTPDELKAVIEKMKADESVTRCQECGSDCIQPFPLYPLWNNPAHCVLISLCLNCLYTWNPSYIKAYNHD